MFLENFLIWMILLRILFIFSKVEKFSEKRVPNKKELYSWTRLNILNEIPRKYFYLFIFFIKPKTLEYFFNLFFSSIKFFKITGYQK